MLHFLSGTITLATLTSLLPTLARRFAGWYKHSMYSVHTLGIAMPRAMPAMPLANSPGQTPLSSQYVPSASAYHMHLQQTVCILGIAQYCIGTYYAIVQYVPNHYILVQRQYILSTYTGHSYAPRYGSYAQGTLPWSTPPCLPSMSKYMPILYCTQPPPRGGDQAFMPTPRGRRCTYQVHNICICNISCTFIV
jgi:hypothetical protein